MVFSEVMLADRSDGGSPFFRQTYRARMIPELRKAWRTVAPGRGLLDGELGAAADHFHQVVDVDRLDQMAVETGVEHPPQVLRLAVAGQRDQFDVARGRVGAQPARHLVAVDAGQADVD